MRIIPTFLFLLTFCMSFGQEVSWLKRAGSLQGFVQASQLVIDHSHNIIISGVLNDTTDFGSITINNKYYNDGYIVKYDSLGNVLWAKSILGSSTDHIGQCVVDNANNIYVAGYFQGANIYFTTTDSLQKTVGANNGFIAKYAYDGSFLWAKPIRSNNDAKLWTIGMDPHGNPIIGGYFKSDVRIGDSAYTSPNSGLFMAKLTPDGVLIWGKVATAPTVHNLHCKINEISTDTLGNIYATGKQYMPLIFSSVATPIIGGDDVWYGKFDSMGNRIFVKVMGDNATTSTTGAGLDVGTCIKPDNAGGFYLGGSYHLADPDPSMQEGFIAKCDDTGGIVWESRFGMGKIDAITGIAFDRLMNPYISGVMSVADTICGTVAPFTPRGNTFVARLDRITGNVVWIKNSTSVNGKSGRELVGVRVTGPIAVDRLSGSVVISGQYNQDFSLDAFTVNTLYTDTLKADIFIARIKNSVPPPTTAIGVVPDTETMTVYPNPTKQAFTVSFGSAASRKIVLLNIMGQVVYEWETEQQSFTADISDLRPGNYYLAITGKDGNKTVRKLTQL